MTPNRFLALMLVLSAMTAASGADCRRGLSFAEPAITSLILDTAAYGDFNEDGRPDVALMFSDSRIIALNRGAVFQPMPRELISGAFSIPLIVATDVDRDGHLDLVYRSGNVVEVALGWGNGAFRPLLGSILPKSNSSWRMIDFDHDGALDFVDFAFNSGGFTFVRSKRDGTFAEVSHLDLSSGFYQAISTTAGDFDGDGNVDVLRMATELPSFRSVLTFGWNDGSLHFTETREITDVPHSLQPVDIDGDGAEELVAIEDGSLVIVRVKNRHPAIERIPVAPKGTTQTLQNLTMVDADGDGIRDLVFSAGSVVGIIPGTADHHFRDASYFELPGSGGIAVLDLDADGHPDFAATSGSQGLHVLYGATLVAGRPNANRVYPAGPISGTLALSDVNGDGIRDLVEVSLQGGEAFRATVLFGDGRGGFPRAAEPLLMPSKFRGTSGLVGDFDGDGHADLAISSGLPATKPVIAFGTADGFAAPTLELDADYLAGVVSLDSSAVRQLVGVKGDDVQFFSVSSGRNVSTATIYHRPAGARVLAVRSDSNAPPRIAIVTATGIRLVTRTSNGWEESVLADSTFYIATSAIAAADLDGDGRDDFVISGDTTRAFFARSDGTYSSLSVAAAGGFVDSITPADFDGDGKQDLVVTSRGNFGYPGVVQVLRNVAGNFQPYATATSGAPFGGGALVQDVDGDGLPDVLIPSFDGAEIMNNICVPPRIRVVAVPADPVEGARVTLVAHAISTDAFAIGGITISEGGTVLDREQPHLAYDLATMSWTSPPLTAGTHTYRIDYDDQFAGSSQTTIAVTTKPAIPRRRAARQ
jgi:hypothetical protein